MAGVPDPWDPFERAVRETGRIHEHARLLTDLELLNLLACGKEERTFERRVLAKEAVRRASERRGEPEVARRLVTRLAQRLEPPGAPGTRALKDEILAHLHAGAHGAGAHEEPVEWTFEAETFSSLPSRDDYRDAS